MLQWMAAVAELETGLISKHTKDALAAAKASGKTFGGNRGTKLAAKIRMAGCRARTARATARATIAPMISELQVAGGTSARAIAAALNARGIPTASGEGTWQAVQVQRALARIGA